MRVQLSGERGAVAVITVGLVVVMIGIAGFVADFGTAYVSKRQLQTAADAAALAAAGQLARHPGSCADVAGDTDAVAAARDVADDYAGRNRPGIVRSGFFVDCSFEDRAVRTRYRGYATTESIFGPIFGVSRIAAERVAVAQAGVPRGALGVRPFLVCAGDIDGIRAALASTGWARVGYPGTGCAPYAADWYVGDCPPSDTARSLAGDTRRGCAAEIGPVDVSGAATPAELAAVLVTACTPPPNRLLATCLQPEPSPVDVDLVSAWDALLGRDVVLPVFDQAWNDTVAAALCPGGDPTAPCAYPVQALLGVTVCGYQWGLRNAAAGTPACAGAAVPPGAGNALWLRSVNVMTTGTPRFSPCHVGDPCDLGTREVHLLE